MVKLLDKIIDIYMGKYDDMPYFADDGSKV